jgi:alpha,alpha-trehalase
MPKNLLFIDPGVTPNSVNNTPMNGDLSDPMAQAGAALKSLNIASESDPTTPTDAASGPAATEGPVPKEQRVGQMNQAQKELPHVHAEPNEYYGGAQVWSRARTFSNVSGTARYRSCGQQLMRVGRNRGFQKGETAAYGRRGDPSESAFVSR